MKFTALFLSVFGLLSCQSPSATTPEKPAVSNMSLAGSEWGTSMERQFVSFGTNGKITGNGGCNRFFGTYSQDGDTLEIGPLGSTKMACANLRQEQTFFQTLNATRTIEASHLRLVLKGADGEALLALKRRDWD